MKYIKMNREKYAKDSRCSVTLCPENCICFLLLNVMNWVRDTGYKAAAKIWAFQRQMKEPFVISAQFQRIRFGRFCGWLSLLEAGIVSYLKQRKF